MNGSEVNLVFISLEEDFREGDNVRSWLRSEIERGTRRVEELGFEEVACMVSSGVAIYGVTKRITTLLFFMHLIIYSYNMLGLHK